MVRRHVFDVGSTIDVAHTSDTLHAHVELPGVTVEPGDQILIHDAPADLALGRRYVCTRRATVVRAGWTERWWIRLRSPFAITELYEVSFSPGALPAPAARRKS